MCTFECLRSTYLAQGKKWKPSDPVLHQSTFRSRLIAGANIGSLGVPHQNPAFTGTDAYHIEYFRQCNLKSVLKAFTDIEYVYNVVNYEKR